MLGWLLLGGAGVLRRWGRRSGVRRVLWLQPLPLRVLWAAMLLLPFASTTPRSPGLACPCLDTWLTTPVRLLLPAMSSLLLLPPVIPLLMLPARPLLILVTLPARPLPLVTLPTRPLLSLATLAAGPLLVVVTLSPRPLLVLITLSACPLLRHALLGSLPVVANTLLMVRVRLRLRGSWMHLWVRHSRLYLWLKGSW